MNSLWISQPQTPVETLSGKVDTDVVVIGAGMTGAATALRLHEAGCSVVLLEARRAGQGNSGRSTGNLYATVSQGLAAVTEKWDAEQVRCAVSARAQAIAWVRDTAARLRIDCDLVDVPLHQCVAEASSPASESLRAEYEAMLQAGLPASWSQDIDGWPLPASAAITLVDQAQLNPYRFVTGVVAHLRSNGVRVYENSRAIDIDASAGTVTTAGGVVHADKAIVMATHTPAGFNLLQAEMQAYREYGVAGRLSGPDLPPASVWVKDDARRSIRTWHDDGVQHLVVVGGMHKTGEDGGIDHATPLRRYAEAHFPVESFAHQWSAQQYRSADGLPYIGASAHENVFLATGFGADGLVWGTVAAAIICDSIEQKDKSPVAELLAARRFTPLKSAKAFAKENTSVAGHLLGDRLKSRKDRDGAPEIAPGSGRVIRIDGTPCAVFRDADGGTTTLSAVCPHLKCLVQWNGAEQTWHCPCHGSRFDTAGCVIEGPALAPLQRKSGPD